MLGVVAVLALATIAFFGYDALSDDAPEAGPEMRDMAETGVEATEARAAVAPAVVDADADALAAVAEDHPDAFADATDVTLGEAATAPLGPSGYAVFTFEATAGEYYSVVVEGDGDLATAVLPPDGATPIAPADTVVAGADGPHRLVVAAEDGDGDVSVTVAAVEVTPVDLAADEPLEGEIADAGDVVVYEVDATAGSHYVVDIDDPDLSVSVAGPDGAAVPTEPDVDLGTPRFVAEADGAYRVLISSGTDGATGAFTIDLFEVAEYFFYYDGEAVPGLTLERTTEEFQAPIDDSGQRAHFCLFLREGVRIVLTIRVTSATLDMGIDVHDETDAGDLIARVNANPPGVSEQWSGTASHDLRRCFQLWAVDYTAGEFLVDFEAEVP